MADWSLAGTPAVAGCKTDLMGFASLGDGSAASFVVIFVLSTMLPVGIFLGITNVRRGRKELIEDLQGVFSVRRGDTREPVVNSFEILKSQYDAETSAFDSLGVFVQYLIPVFLFVVLCWIGFTASLSGSVPDCFEQKLSPLINPTGTLIGSLSYTFFGAYLWSVTHLIRRVANYDLSPISFLQAISHLLLAIFVSAAIWHAHLLEKMGPNFMVVAAFMIGWFPDLFFSGLAARFPILALKPVDAKTMELREELPLDTILGIDPFIKLRLNEHEIMDVQNLATANPIKLFVETPYGLYETIDWVAQAQLILAVGAANVVELRKHNIRTIFDLEKGARNKAINAKLLAILRAEAPPKPPPPAPPSETDELRKALMAPPLIASSAADDARYDRYRVNTERVLDLDDELAAFVAIIRDDLHVRRLRQIWDTVNGRLNLRVEPSAPAPQADGFETATAATSPPPLARMEASG